MDISTKAHSSTTKTRIAPTPSGYLHLGNLFSFALTAALAHQKKAQTLLRIDDLDRQRAQPEYIQDIFDTLNFMGIPWHEGPRNPQEFEQQYSQMHRLALYNQALDTLRHKNLLYACDCSRTKILQADPTGAYTGRCRSRNLPFEIPGVNWRIRTDHEAPLTFQTLNDLVTTFLPQEQHDFVVRKKDGYPAYQLASVVDDQHFGVNLIVRGMDLWPSTLAQLYLARVLDMYGFSNSIFHHHTLLTETGGRKLSKSAGDTSIQYLQSQGKTAANLYALIAGMAGMQESVHTWQTLGDKSLKSHLVG